jgi:hypothetical protein
LDAILAIDNPNGVAETDNGRIIFISLPMACQSLRNVYPGLGRLLLGRLLNLGLVGLGYMCRSFKCHAASKEKALEKGRSKSG